MSFVKIPEPREPPPKRPSHSCEPPQRLPDGKGVPVGTVWRCGTCGAANVAEIYATWYGMLVMNLVLIAYLPWKFFLIFNGARHTMWTRRKTFFIGYAIFYTPIFLLGWFT